MEGRAKKEMAGASTSAQASSAHLGRACAHLGRVWALLGVACAHWGGAYAHLGGACGIETSAGPGGQARVS